MKSRGWWLLVALALLLIAGLAATVGVIVPATHFARRQLERELAA